MTASATLFDTHVIVDWSARSAPSPAKPSKDAIWIGVARDGGVETTYLRTRAAAEAWLIDFFAAETAAGRRALVGFDFPFGYPAGVAETVSGEASALALWNWFATHVDDSEDNANNRYDVAAKINRLYPGIGPFWGTPGAQEIADVPARGNDRTGDHPPERRASEGVAKGAKTVWQLAGAGAVGSQVIMGLASLQRVRTAVSDVSIWPFQTGWTAPETDHLIAEIYPSLFAVPSDAIDGEIGDERQVRVTAEAYRSFDEAGDLTAMLRGPAALDAETRAVVEREEAWILGLGHPAIRQRSAPRLLTYERDPKAIYAASFATVRAEAKLDHLPEDLRDIAIRLVHSCGMTDVPNRLAWSDDVATSARAALQTNGRIYCDCEMVGSGIIRRLLPADCDVRVTLNDPRTPDLAKDIGNTRSAAAVELWRDEVEGAVVVIGNAPTTLFHLLELIDEGWPKPAAILGFPVGFIGAAESKAELAARPRGVPFLTLRGRRGGSAMASAALNAIAGGLG